MEHMGTKKTLPTHPPLKKWKKKIVPDTKNAFWSFFSEIIQRRIKNMSNKKLNLYDIITIWTCIRLITLGVVQIPVDALEVRGAWDIYHKYVLRLCRHVVWIFFKSYLSKNIKYNDCDVIYPMCDVREFLFVLVQYCLFIWLIQTIFFF